MLRHRCVPLDCRFRGVAVLSVGRIVRHAVYASPLREVNSRPPLGKEKRSLMRTATKTVLSALMTTGLCLSVIGCGSSGDSSQSEMQGNESNQIKSNKPKRLRQAPRGCCPGRAAARRTASRTYRRTSRARRPCIGGRSGKPRQKPTASQGSAEAFARTEDSRRQIAASMPHASGPIDRRPRPRLSKRPRKRPWDGQLRRRKCTKRNAAPKAPQERRRGCTRTPRRRRRSGWMRP